MSSDHVTVVIPALNAADTLARQLDALNRQDFAGQFAVVVVDNGSTDDTATVATNHRATGYALRVVGERRKGINWARNAGIAAASDGQIFLCDADDVVAAGWLRAMTRDLGEGVWVAGRLDYKLLNTPRTRVIWDAAEMSGFRESTPYQDNTYGCNCGFTKAMWEQVGGFDSTLSGSGGDENEFFMRAHAAGFRPRHVPDGIVAYTLRPGVRKMMRQRFRQGKNQVKTRLRPGGLLMPEQFTRRGTAGALGWTILALPKYMFSARLRNLWLGSVSRHAGRLVQLSKR